MAFGLISAGIGAIGGIAQGIAGARQASKAQSALENYNRQDLDPVTSDLQVYTQGAEMQMQEQARLGSTAVDAMSRAGTRGLGFLGNLEQSQALSRRQIAADLQQQQARIDQMRVQDAMDVRKMQERREEADIAALSSQYQAGQQMLWSGIGSVAQAGMSGLQMGQNYDLSQQQIKAGFNPATTTV